MDGWFFKINHLMILDQHGWLIKPNKRPVLFWDSFPHLASPYSKPPTVISQNSDGLVATMLCQVEIPELPQNAGGRAQQNSSHKWRPMNIHSYVMVRCFYWIVSISWKWSHRIPSFRLQEATALSVLGQFRYLAADVIKWASCVYQDVFQRLLLNDLTLF